MSIKKDDFRESNVEQYMQRATSISSTMALRSQIFTAVKPVLDRLLHFDTIIDVGCGIGFAAHVLSGYYNRYIGIDPSAEIIEAARQLNRKNQKAQFIAQDARNVDLADETAEVILCFGSLHHMENIDGVLDSLRRLARPGAFLIIVEPHNNSPFGFLYRFLRKTFDPTFVGDQVYYSEDYIRDLVERHGFTNLKTHFQGFLSTPFAQAMVYPQYIFAPLSLVSVSLDGLFQSFLPDALKKMAVNLIIVARMDSKGANES